MRFIKTKINYENIYLQLGASQNLQESGEDERAVNLLSWLAQGILEELGHTPPETKKERKTHKKGN